MNWGLVIIEIFIFQLGKIKVINVPESAGIYDDSFELLLGIFETTHINSKKIHEPTFQDTCPKGLPGNLGCGSSRDGLGFRV